MKTKYRFNFYFALLFPPVWFLWAFLMLFFFNDKYDYVGLGIQWSIIIFMLSLLFFIRKEYKQVALTEQLILLNYTFLPHRKRLYTDYDGYVVANVGRMKYIYLMKGHRRKESINLDFYANADDLQRELEKRMKCLGCINVGTFAHTFRRGGKIEY